MVGPRRRNHEGTTPTLRADGRWEVRVAIEGVRYSDYGRTPDEALAKHRKRISQHDAGFRPMDGKVTVSEWLQEWVDVYVAPVKAQRTTVSYRDIVDRYLIPSIGTVRLARLSAEPQRIQRMLAQLSRNPKIGLPTVRYVFVVLRIAMRRAVKAGRLQIDPTSFVDAPDRSTFEVAPLDAAEASRLLESVSGHRYEALIRVLVSAGLRRGELLGLTWPAVDLKAGTLHVRWQLQEGDLVEPKRHSIRTIDLPDETIAALEAHKARQVRPLPVAVPNPNEPEWDDREFVFAGDKGRPLNPRGVARAFDTVLKRAGFPHQRLHDLRHAFATILLEEGEDLAVIQKLLGHKSFGTTADIYAHLTKGMRRRAASRMGTALRQRRAP